MIGSWRVRERIFLHIACELVFYTEWGEPEKRVVRWCEETKKAISLAVKNYQKW